MRTYLLLCEIVIELCRLCDSDDPQCLPYHYLDRLVLYLINTFPHAPSWGYFPFWHSSEQTRA